MPAPSKYDMVVIGAGPGGYVAAIRAGQLGMKTAVVERGRVGGRCLNEACIPAKAVLRIADLWSEVGDSKQFGIQIKDPNLDWSGVVRRRDRVIKTLTGGVGSLLKKHGVDLVQGTASLIPEGGVLVGGNGEQRLATPKVILATGSVPLPIPGTELGGRVLDPAGAWLIDERPDRLAVIGAGPSGAEIASAFSRLGTEVVLIEMLDRVLPTEDEEISAEVERALGKQKIKVATGTRVDDVRAEKGKVALEWQDETADFDYICIAAGRGADVEALNLDAAQVRTAASGHIEVDWRMHTSHEGVYAIGDLVPGPALAHKASEEGIIAAEDAAGLETAPLVHDYIPRVTFCYPQVASMGLTERQAVERLGDVSRVKVGRFPYGGIGAATVYGERNGLIKLVADSQYGEILGAHIVGARAGDLIAELSVAHAAESTYESLARTIHAHPTFSEGVMEAARAVDGWAIHS